MSASIRLARSVTDLRIADTLRSAISAVRLYRRFIPLAAAKLMCSGRLRVLRLWQKLDCLPIYWLHAACEQHNVCETRHWLMLMLISYRLIGFHVLTGARILNTLSDHSQCTVVFNVIITLIGIMMSFPRTLRHVSFMSMGSAFFMALAVLLFMIFAGIEDHPTYGYGGNYPELGEVKTYAFPAKGTTFVAAMNAVLNITFIWVPQILFPTFISEMEKPQDCESVKH